MSSEPKEADVTGRESAFRLLFWVVERRRRYKDIALRDMDALVRSARRTACVAVSGELLGGAAEAGALQAARGLQ